ncbi:MAG TPA: ABC-2 family transporter protein [Anaerolineales bacterium]|nr:ABC-2 family transporter protein [Anaerolineales bacterium]
MKRIAKYWFIFQTTLVNSLAYPGELIGRSLMMIPFMWIFYQLWKVTFGAAGSDVINGLTLQDTLWYLMMAETIELGRPPLARTISENIKDGSIAYLLNKPYDFMLYQLSSSMGETIFRAILNALFGGAIVWILVGAPPHPEGLIIALPAILGAWVLHFCVNAMIGLLAFALEDVSAFVWIYQKLAFIFGGLLIPLDFYPQWLQAITRALPFSSTIYGPSRLFVSPTLELFFNVMLLQILWIIILGLSLTLAYRRGLAQLTVNGG